ncbi:CPXV173 protein, partial [Monkeypox virus]
MHYTN